MSRARSNSERNIQSKLERAKARTASIKGFYTHATIYVLMNTVILVIRYLMEMDHSENFWSWPTFAVVIFWGIGLCAHAFRVFGFYRIFGPDWEARKIQKYMEDETKY